MSRAELARFAQDVSHDPQLRQCLAAARPAGAEATTALLRAQGYDIEAGDLRLPATVPELERPMVAMLAQPSLANPGWSRPAGSPAGVLNRVLGSAGGQGAMPPAGGVMPAPLPATPLPGARRSRASRG